MSEADYNPYEAPRGAGADTYRASRRGSSDLTTGDWLLIIFCSGIACIIGIIRLIQGKPNAGKMIGFSLIAAFLWSFLRLIIELGAQGPGR